MSNIFKLRTYVLLILLGLFLAACSPKEKDSSTDSIVTKKEDSLTQFQKNLYSHYLDSLVLDSDFNGVISIRRDSTLLYQRFEGFENFKSKVQLDSNSVFAIGSVSKQFTSALLLRLVDKNLLSLSDSLPKHLSKIQNPSYKNITVEQLLNHSSGMNDFSSSLHAAPGSTYHYSNKGYSLLGEIIESVGKKSYSDQLKELTLHAGMNSTFTPQNKPSNHFASAYTGTHANPIEVENMPDRLALPSISTAAGGVLSAVGDLHRWNQRLHEGLLLSPETLKGMRTSTKTTPHYILGQVGYGYGIMTSTSTLPSYFHTGYVKGSASLLIYYPHSKTSVVILSNYANEQLGKKMIFHVHQKTKEFTDLIEASLPRVN